MATVPQQIPSRKIVYYEETKIENLYVVEKTENCSVLELGERILVVCSADIHNS